MKVLLFLIIFAFIILLQGCIAITAISATKIGSKVETDLRTISI